DYTVIGPNVNMVARIEELTKAEQIQNLIGLNGILLTKEAQQNLKIFSSANVKPCHLPDLGVHVRSFEEIASLYYLKKDDAIEIANKTTIKRMTNPHLPLPG